MRLCLWFNSKRSLLQPLLSRIVLDRNASAEQGSRKEDPMDSLTDLQDIANSVLPIRLWHNHVSLWLYAD